jgi:phenylalanyl-tRNA synthetase beta chain
VVKTALKNWGYVENYTYSLISEELINRVGQKPKGYLEVKNPLTQEWRFLRKSLLPSLLHSLSYNQERKPELKLFELANIYIPRDKELPIEEMQLSMVYSADNYFSLKGDLEAAANELGAVLEFKPTDKHNFLEPQIQADIIIKGENIGFIGQVTPQIQKEFGLHEPAVVTHLSFDKLSKYATKNKVYTPIPSHPPIIEDVTFFNEARVPAALIIKTAYSINPIVYKVEIVSIFQDKISLRVSYLNPQKNLTSETVAPLRRQLVAAIEKLGLSFQNS